MPGLQAHNLQILFKISWRSKLIFMSNSPPWTYGYIHRDKLYLLSQVVISLRALFE